jgi:ferredoxin
MGEPAPKKPGFMSWLLFGSGPGPGEPDDSWRREANSVRTKDSAAEPAGKLSDPYDGDPEGKKFDDYDEPEGDENGDGALAGEIDETEYAEPSKKSGKKAIKCDMCRGRKGGPACVAACPTGAAVRVSPEDFLTNRFLEREIAES